MSSSFAQSLSIEEEFRIFHSTRAYLYDESHLTLLGTLLFYGPGLIYRERNIYNNSHLTSFFSVPEPIGGGGARIFSNSRAYVCRERAIRILRLAPYLAWYFDLLSLRAYKGKSSKFFRVPEPIQREEFTHFFIFLQSTLDYINHNSINFGLY